MKILLIIGGILLGIWMIFWIQKILADPPHEALLTFLGKRIKRRKKEGYRIFWGYPIFFNYIPINVETKKESFTQVVRTHRLAELMVPIDLEFVPVGEAVEIQTIDITGKITKKKIKEGELLINYLNRGEEEGIKKNFVDRISERLREWVLSPEGPRTAKALMAASEIAVTLFLKAIVGAQLNKIDSEVPTSILFKYFNTKKILTPYEFQTWGGKEWKEVRKKWLNYQREGKDFEEAWELTWEELSEKERWKKIEKQLEKEDKEKIEKQIKERKEAVRKVRQGMGEFIVESFGVRLLRLNIGEIKPAGKLAERMELQAVEEQERRGEIFEIETDLQKAQQIVKAVKETGKELPLTTAYQIVLEWKTTREGRGFTIPGLSSSIERIARAVLGGKEK
jgi:hypothetical protein